MKIQASAYIKDNQLLIRNRHAIINELLSTGWIEMDVVFSKKKKNRSYEQNKYYWGVVVAMVRARFIELGNQVSAEETHDYMKQEFNYREFVDEKTGAIYRVPLSTANLTTSQFMDYLAKIQQFSSEVLDINIPDPGQQVEMNL